MTNNKFSLRIAILAIFTIFIASFYPVYGKEPVPGTGLQYDVINYRIEAQLDPNQHMLYAGADITFIPEEETRSVVFELNGSLFIESIQYDNQPLTSFVQDSVGTSALGPNVRIDLGQVMPAGQSITLRIRWKGALTSPEGGPLMAKRLAYVGSGGSYLMYASRWFPFHEYASDRAMSDITIIVPTGMVVGGSSDKAIIPQQNDQTGTTHFRFVNQQPVLVGNFIAGNYITKTLHFDNYEIQFFVKPGSENRVIAYGESIGRALKFYTKQYGVPAFGSRFIVAQTDDETLDTYSGSGILFLSSNFFDSPHPAPEERLQREAAYQWWGQTVGLKSFDDVWISQGLAEWSSFAVRETTLSQESLSSVQREQQERALIFEQAASIARAPGVLDDQSAAYQSIVIYKGAVVFRMLRDAIGEENFSQLLSQFLEQYRNKNASINDFEQLTNQITGQNMRYFFAQWVEGTGVPEFNADYLIIRTNSGKFRTRGTVKQNFESLRMPVELMLRSEGENNQTITVQFNSESVDFNFESKGLPIEVVVDPNNKILRMSDDLKILIVARRGIELFREGQYTEAQQQFELALNLDGSNAWVYYNLGLLFMEQKNWRIAIDHFQAALDSNNSKPDWMEVWARIKRGNAYDALGDRLRAVNEYNKVLEIGNNYDNAQEVVKGFLATPFDSK